MGTPLQILYDRFQSKLDEDLSGKGSLIFALVDSAIAMSYKTCRHPLTYQLTNEETFDGNFSYELDNDEVELIALWMKYDWNWRELQRLYKERDTVGTSDFNRLPSRKDSITAAKMVIEATKEEITDLENEFYTYKYK